jgi:hypothetical protein
MTEQDKNDIAVFNLPKQREYSPEDVDRSIGKLGSGVAHILIEVPADVKATPIAVRHATSDLIASTPWSTEQDEVSSESTEPSGGEYRGGDIDRIAARSGVDVEEVRAAALESIRRQRGESE